MIEPIIDEMPTKISEASHRLCAAPLPGAALGTDDRGAYAVQPDCAPIPGTKNAVIIKINAGHMNQ